MQPLKAICKPFNLDKAIRMVKEEQDLMEALLEYFQVKVRFLEHTSRDEVLLTKIKNQLRRLR